MIKKTNNHVFLCQISKEYKKESEVTLAALIRPGLLELIKKDTQASWAWFLEYHTEESMIASKKTNQKWFQSWKDFFDIAVSSQKRKGRPKIIKIIDYIILKKLLCLIKYGINIFNLDWFCNRATWKFSLSWYVWTNSYCNSSSK